MAGGVQYTIVRFIGSEKGTIIDKKIYEGRVKRLREVNTVVKPLDPAIREASFNLLKSYVTGLEIDNAGEGKGGEVAQDKKSFFTKFSHDRPSENVFLVAAYHYSQYGTTPFDRGDIKQIADDVGLIVPDRPDMTLKNAQKKGKSLFNSVGAGKYKPTVHGEKYLKETYKVTKGTKKKEENEE